MKKDYIYAMPHTVLYSDTDARGLLSLPAFFSLFQEGALLQAEKLGFGETYCNEKGLMWVLSRLLLDIRAFPGHREGVHLKTWPKHPQGPFATRDFLIESEQGETQARATSAWLLLDTSTMRPVRPQPLNDRKSDPRRQGENRGKWGPSAQNRQKSSLCNEQPHHVGLQNLSNRANRPKQTHNDLKAMSKRTHRARRTMQDKG